MTLASWNDSSSRRDLLCLRVARYWAARPQRGGRCIVTLHRRELKRSPGKYLKHIIFRLLARCGDKTSVRPNTTILASRNAIDVRFFDVDRLVVPWRKLHRDGNHYGNHIWYGNHVWKFRGVLKTRLTRITSLMPPNKRNPGTCRAPLIASTKVLFHAVIQCTCVLGRVQNSILHPVKVGGCLRKIRTCWQELRSGLGYTSFLMRTHLWKNTNHTYTYT